MSRSGRKGKNGDPLGESGAALVIAMLAVVLMTLIGLALLQVVQNGFIHSAGAEGDIRAEILAQDGLDEALSLVRNAVDQANGASGYRDRIAQTEANLTDVIDRISDDPTHHPGVYTVKTERGSYTVDFSLDPGLSAEQRSREITHPTLLPAPDPDGPYVRQIVVVSEGKTSGIQPGRSVKKTMKLYVSTINPIFRYPVSAAADLSLQGAPFIIGDALAGGDLNITKKAHFIIESGISEYDAESDYPSLKGFIQAMSGHYTLDGSSRTSFERSFFSKYQPFADRSLELGEPLNIAAAVATKTSAVLSTSYDAPLTWIGLDGAQIGDGYNGAQAAIGSPGSMSGIRFSDDQWVSVKGNLDVYGNMLLTRGLLRQEQGASLQIHGGSISAHLNDPDLIAADMSGSIALDDGQFMAVDGNAVLNNLTFRGTMFVKGNLKIIGDLNVDGTIYVDGSVELKEMNSINQNTGFADKPVIVAATGKIDMSDNMKTQISSTSGENKLRAFLYSDQDMNVYGVLSRLLIKGGIHGRNVMLSGVRGNFSTSPGIDGFTGNAFVNTNVSPAGSGYYFTDGQSSLAADLARLKVFYDNQLYNDPPAGIPVTDQVSVFVKQIDYIQ